MRTTFLLVIGVIACSGEVRPTTGSIEGVVQYADAGSHAGIRVVLLGTDHAAVSDDAGHFVIGAVAPGTYAIEAMSDGYVAARKDVTVVAGTPSAIQLALDRVPATTGWITGTFTRGPSPTGNAGIVVSVLGTSWSATTRDDGKFRIDQVTPGTWSLQATAAGYVSQVVEVKVTAGQGASPEPVALTPATHPAGRVTGVVTRAGAQTGNGGIAVFLEHRGDLAVTDDSGAFVLDDVPPGEYALDASTPGYIVGRANVVVTDGKTTQLATLELPVAQVYDTALSGGVSGFAGPLGRADASGVRVSLTGNGSALAMTTGQDGAWSFTSLPVGMYALTYQMDGFESVTSGSVAVLPGTYEVPPVLLYPGTKVSDQDLLVFSAIAGGTKALTRVGALPGLFVYDWATKSLGSLLPVASWFDVVQTSPDGSRALLNLGWSELVEADLDALTVTPRARYSQLLGVYADRLLFADDLGELWTLRLGEAPAAGPSLPCSLQPYTSVAALKLGNSPVGGWVQLMASGSCGGVGMKLLVDVTTGHAGPLGDTVAVLDDASAALVNDQTNLYKLDLTTGAATVIAHPRVVGPAYSGWLSVFSDVDPQTQLGSILRVSLADGHVETLATLATMPGWASRSMIRAGDPATWSIVDIAAGTLQSVCSFAGSQLEGYNGAYIGCMTSTQLLALDFDTGKIKPVGTSSGWWSPWSPAPHVVTWNDASGAHVTRTDNDLAPLTLCSNGSSVAVSADGITAVAGCGTALLAADLTSGKQRTLFTVTGTRTFGGTVAVAGGGVFATTYDSNGDTTTCGGSACLLIVDEPRAHTLFTPTPDTYGSLVSSSTQGGVFIGDTHIHLADDAIHVYKPPAPSSWWWGSQHTWSEGGRCLLQANGILSDADKGTAVTDVVTNVTRLGTSEDLVGGSNIIHLSTCSVEPIAQAFTPLTITSAGVLIYRDDVTQALKRYTPGTGFEQIAANAQLVPWYGYFPPTHHPLFVNRSGQSGDLIDVTQDGVIRTLVTGAYATMAGGGLNRTFTWTNFDASTGETLLVDLEKGVATPLHVRTPLSSYFSVSSRSILLSGWTGTDTSAPMQLIRTDLDGSNVHAIAPSSAVVIADERQVFFTWNGLLWAESLAGGPSVAISGSDAHLSLSPDRTSALVSACSRNPGTHLVTLP